MVTGAVVVSSQTTSTRAANLLASFIIIPMSMLVMLEGSIMVQPHQRYLLWYIMVGLLVTVDTAGSHGRADLQPRGTAWPRRSISLTCAGRSASIWAEVRGPIGDHFTLGRWYRLSVFPAVRSLRSAASVVLLCAVAAFIGGWIAAGVWTVPLDQFDANDETLMDRLQYWLEAGQSNPQLVVFAAMQNIRVLLAATILATFTFGVLALVLTMIPFGIFGFIIGQVVLSGLSPLPFLLGIIPHGIAEVPAILLAGAAALRLGSIITRPPDDTAVGEAWLRAVGGAIKVGVGVVLPLLIVAAMLEVWLTPRVVEFVLTH